MSAYFSFEQRQGQEFVFQLNDLNRIEFARRVVSGDERYETHVLGRIRRGKKPYNPNWDYYLDPDTIKFFAYAIEVCDANMQYVDDHLDEAGGAFLPGYFCCPWDSTVTREIEDVATA